VAISGERAFLRGTKGGSVSDHAEGYIDRGPKGKKKFLSSDGKFWKDPGRGEPVTARNEEGGGHLLGRKQKTTPRTQGKEQMVQCGQNGVKIRSLRDPEEKVLTPSSQTEPAATEILTLKENKSAFFERGATEDISLRFWERAPVGPHGSDS